jgi:endonuclease-3
MSCAGDWIMIKKNVGIRASKVYLELKKNYPSVPLLFLSHTNDAQMICAIILSAQSTDAQVNRVTSPLFKKYNSVNDFADADLKVFEKEIESTGYYKQKAKRIIECFKIIRDKHFGKIPLTMHELIELPGVGRKTANLVLANKGIVEGIAVDTHVWRLSQRLGFSSFDDQHKIELDLMSIFPKKVWHEINGLLISHGRKVCTARNPKCKECFLNKKKLCPKIGVN